MVQEAEDVFEEGIGEEEGQEAEGPQIGARIHKNGCRFCPAGPFQTPQRRQRHERRDHPEEYKGLQQGRRAEKASGGIPAEAMSERTRFFAEVLEAVAPDLKANQRQLIIKGFEEDSSVLSRDPNELENFLDDMGLNLHQIRTVVRRMVGRQRRKGEMGDWGNGQAPVMALDPRTGQQVPIFVFNQGSDRSPQMPPVIMPGWSQHEESITKDDVVDIVESVLERTERRKPKEEPGSRIPVRRYQEFQMDEEGNVRTDRSGNPIFRWVEEPVDPLTSTLTALSNLGLFKKSELTPEQIVQLMRSAVPESTEDPEMRSLRDEFRELRHSVDKKEAIEDAVRRANEEFISRIGPKIQELEELKNRGEMSDEQASLYHQERLYRDTISAVTGLREGLREDLQPLFLPMAAASMRGMGMSEQSVADIISAVRNPSTATPRSATSANTAAAMSRWLKD